MRKTISYETNPDRIEIFGVPLDAWTMQETVEEICRRMDTKKFTQHVVVNVAKLVNMQRNAVLREAVVSCDIINIDGMGVVWGGRFLGLRIPERVAGIDLFWNLLSLASHRGEPVFFLGAKPEVLEQAVVKVRDTFPDLKIAGWHHGYFRDDELSVVERIRTSRATMLFVGITSPRKEQFINRYRESLGVKFAMGVGGTFNVVAGTIRRAPKWMQRAGLEWFYRLLQEPRRMWRRYLVTNVRFAAMLVTARMQSFRGRTRY